jgi:hypothetical protein
MYSARWVGSAASDSDRLMSLREVQLPQRLRVSFILTAPWRNPCSDAKRATMGGSVSLATFLNVSIADFWADFVLGLAGCVPDVVGAPDIVGVPSVGCVGTPGVVGAPGIGCVGVSWEVGLLVGALGAGYFSANFRRAAAIHSVFSSRNRSARFCVTHMGYESRTAPPGLTDSMIRRDRRVLDSVTSPISGYIITFCIFNLRAKPELSANLRFA